MKCTNFLNNLVVFIIVFILVPLAPLTIVVSSPQLINEYSYFGCHTTFGLILHFGGFYRFTWFGTFTISKVRLVDLILGFEFYYLFYLTEKPTEVMFRFQKWFKYNGFWKYFVEYFPMKLVKTVDLPPDRNYMIWWANHNLVGQH